MKLLTKTTAFLPILFLIFLFFSLTQNNHAQTAKNFKFINGNWFNGKTFKRKVFYSVGGVFTSRAPSKIDETIDLKNGFVIPPFGDAHTHNLDGKFNLEKLIQAYLEEGTFYVQVLGNHSTGAPAARAVLNKPSTPDVIYANGMLTTTYGHPFMVYEPLEIGIYSPAEAFRRVAEVKKSRRDENNAYWFLDTKADVDAKWEKILATKPDVIKIGLIDAKNYEKYVNTDDAVNKGLSPDVAQYVVNKAHQAGLRVFAHIDTADDFRLGVKIGVDGFAHAPYSVWNGRPETKPQDDLTADDIISAAKKNIVMIPTAQIGTYSAVESFTDGKYFFNEERLKLITERHKNLLRLMHKNGLKIALGLDNFGTTVRPEILYFSENKIFDNLTLLKIAAETTPQAIFPKRKIGKLADGYESSFLVLEKNPLEDFNQIKNIRMRFKQGFFIETRP